jgi:hypothetical protein
MVEIVSIGQAAPVPEVVEMAEEILESAKSGELRSLLYLAEIDGGAGVRYASSAVRNRFEILGFLSRIMHKINARFDSGT